MVGLSNSGHVGNGQNAFYVQRVWQYVETELLQVPGTMGRCRVSAGAETASSPTGGAGAPQGPAQVLLPLLVLTGPLRRCFGSFQTPTQVQDSYLTQGPAPAAGLDLSHR